jgi:inosose dehydratase
MGKICLGNAPDSWGIWFPQDKRQVGWEVFLDEVHEAGYMCICLKEAGTGLAKAYAN